LRLELERDGRTLEVSVTPVELSTLMKR